MSPLPVGKLLCVGVRGAAPGDPLLDSDLDACLQAGVGGVVLFDVDVPTFLDHQRTGMDRAEALLKSHRNILDPGQTANLVAYIRDRLGAGTWVSIDQEGGQVARLNPRRGFQGEPSAVEFAALDPVDRETAAARQAGRLRRLGVDLNFAPCVDLALDPDNEVVVANGRCYGNSFKIVADCADIVVGAHHAAGVAACLKHFPGHGSSRGDTHEGLVDITETWARDDELLPYRALADRPGVAVMAAHVVHRDLDPVRPASLSPEVIDGLLRSELGFDGVVATDSIDMKAVSSRWSPAEAAVMAVQAGVDLVVDGFNLLPDRDHPAPVLSAALSSALADGRLNLRAVENALERLDNLRREISRS